MPIPSWKHLVARVGRCNWAPPDFVFRSGRTGGFPYYKNTMCPGLEDINRGSVWYTMAEPATVAGGHFHVWGTTGNSTYYRASPNHVFDLMIGGVRYTADRLSAETPPINGRQTWGNGKVFWTVLQDGSDNGDPPPRPITGTRLALVLYEERDPDNDTGHPRAWFNKFENRWEGDGWYEVNALPQQVGDNQYDQWYMSPGGTLLNDPASYPDRRIYLDWPVLYEGSGPGYMQPADCPGSQDIPQLGGWGIPVFTATVNGVTYRFILLPYYRQRGRYGSWDYDMLYGTSRDVASTYYRDFAIVNDLTPRDKDGRILADSKTFCLLPRGGHHWWETVGPTRLTTDSSFVFDAHFSPDATPEEQARYASFTATFSHWVQATTMKVSYYNDDGTRSYRIYGRPVGMFSVNNLVR